MKAEAQRSSRERPRFLYLAVALLLLGGAAGCSPKIGGDCTTSTDCSLNGDRLCDITQPGGYCTVFNCEPNGCPDEAVCVAFNETTCSEPAVSNRFRRTFCMKACDSDSDCRGGEYRCVDTTTEPGRQVVDINPSTRRICAVPSASDPAQSDASTPGEPAVCNPSDASFDTSRPEAGPGANDGRSDGSDSAEASTPDVANDATSADRADTSSADRTDTSSGDAPVDAADSTQGEASVDAAEDAASDGEAGPSEASIDAPLDVIVDAGTSLDVLVDAPGETGD